MVLEKLEKAKKLQSQIVYLKEKLESFNPEKKMVYLHIRDHWGNKLGVIETYNFSEEYLEAAGYYFNVFVANAYSEFLAKVRDGIQERIDLIQSELDNL
jgi:hypothetical protein